MIWVLIATYALAGFTIGRMAWEFDAFGSIEQLPSPPGYIVTTGPYDRRRDRRLCIATGLLWPGVPAWGVWIWVRGLRR